VSNGIQYVTIEAVVTDSTNGAPINDASFLSWTITVPPLGLIPGTTKTLAPGTYLISTDASQFQPGYSYSIECMAPNYNPGKVSWQDQAQVVFDLIPFKPATVKILSSTINGLDVSVTWEATAAPGSTLVEYSLTWTAPGPYTPVQQLSGTTATITNTHTYSLPPGPFAAIINIIVIDSYDLEGGTDMHINLYGPFPFEPVISLLLK
jgi:hypothetical protein